MAMAWGSGARAFEESAARVEWSELRALIAQRIPEQVLRRLAYIPADELTHVRPQLKALRAELRAALRSGDEAAHDTAYAQLAPLYLAGILCSGDPAETLDWLTSPVLRDAAWQEPDGTWHEPQMRRILLTLLLEHRDRDWQRDLAGRLARWLPPGGDPRRWQLVDGLTAWAGATPTASDGYVIGWARHGSAVSRKHARGRLDVREWFAELGWRRPAPHYATLVDWLRAQSRLDELVPRLFEVSDIGIEFSNTESDDTPLASPAPADDAPALETPALDRNEWPGALAILAAEGTLDRDELIDRCLAKLLRGDQPENLRGFVLLTHRLAPNVDEIAARLATYVALAARGATPSARLAQSALKDLDDAGRLGPVTIAEVSKAVLARPETSLVIAQLSWIDAAVLRDRAAAPALLRALACAFSHPVVTVQERALRLVMRHLRHLTVKEIAELHEAARELDASLRDEALRVLGGDVDGMLSAAQTPATLLPTYHPPAPPEPLGSVTDLVELFELILADPSASADTRTVESILDTAVAEYERDAQNLADALEPLAVRFPPKDFASWDQREVGGALRCLLYALLGQDQRTIAVMNELYADSSPPTAIATATAAPDRAVLYRVFELIDNLGRVRIPCVLSTPTRGCGAIDPDVLRLRLERYERTGAAPLPCDLEQALLRIPIEEAQEILASSPLLATSAGKELSTLFAWGEGALPYFDRFVIRRAESAQSVHARTRLPRIAPRFSPFHELIAAPDRPPSPITVLSNLPDPDDVRLFASAESGTQTQNALALWPSLLPFHPEIVAAHAIPTLYQQAKDTDRGRNALLPLLATTAGQPGAVTHLALAYGLAAARTQNRAAAVDAMVTLAARRLLDARALGALCGELWAGEMVKPDRLLFAFDAAAHAGARREVFAVVAGTLIALAPQPAVKGLADLLVLGADCARAADVHEDVPEVTALAALDKPTRVVVEARRLYRILNAA